MTSLLLPGQFGSVFEEIPAPNWFKVKPRKTRTSPPLLRCSPELFTGSGTPQVASQAGAKFLCRSITCLFL